MDFSKTFLLSDWEHLACSISNNRKKDIEKFLNMLKDISFAEMPASTTYHGCFAGGLIDHLTRVAYIADHVRIAVAPDIDRDSVIISAMLHDISKIGIFKEENGKMVHIPRYVKTSWFEKSKPVSKTNPPYQYNPNLPNLSMTFWNLGMAARYLDLTIAEWKTIAFHDGQYVDENQSVYRNHEAEPLLLVVHFADILACQYESKTNFNKNNFKMF